MSLFRNTTHAEIWVEANCEMGCWRDYKTCPILERALRTDRKPPEWERNTRSGALMAETIKCAEKSKTPPHVHKRVDLDVPMFDVQPVTTEPDHA